MGKTTYELTPRDVLFFRDARPMDVDTSRKDVFNVGHGAHWPRPDQLFSAVIHELVRDPSAPEGAWYGKVKDLRVTGPFPLRDGTLYLPMPLDWDMRLVAFDAALGTTDIPAPLTAGFADRVVEKKSHPKWIPVADYARYLRGEEGRGKDQTESDAPTNDDASLLFLREPRLGTTLDADTGASKRVDGKTGSGRYAAEYLRLGKGVKFVCAVETERDAELKDRWVRFGGQGGLVRFEAADDLDARLCALLPGTPTRFVRWTLLAPALFAKGWYPNWLEETADGTRTGKVMLPMEEVLRRPGESRADYRARMNVERRPFETARLIAACVGKAVAFSGYDSQDREKPTELAVPAGSSYVFACETVEEAKKLAAALHLKARSDLGEKGFGLGVCSYVSEPEKFTAESNN